MNEIWRDILKNETQTKLKKSFRLPVIIPIVLYNGKNNWTASTEFKEKLDAEEFNHFKNWLEEIFINRLPITYHDQIYTIISKANHQEVDKMISNFEQGLKRFIEESQQKAIETGLKKGLEQGLGQGQKQKAVEIAKALINKGMNRQDIADVAGLSIKEVEKLGRE
ncbi:Rpn family recombination-promoting nuclease/putative transposase [Paraliobacillus sediminis]|uniref:Rpn family recombination-promoting nuclease/putative transposase n=1 Tax=Paraliobacillus sediminis TaxID=1885916 RepID=UPI000E3D0244